MAHPAGRVLRRLVLEGLGWLLVVAGIAALVLPGPGLLALFAGLALLSQQYAWAERRLEPVKVRAITTARQSVQTWPRILASLSGCAVLIGLGIVCGLHPAVPSWWPVDERWWFPGGWGTGVSLIASGLIALATIVYSVRVHRGPSAPGAP
jgi:hypothetical protein